MFFDILGAIVLVGLGAALIYCILVAGKYTAKVEQYKIKILEYLVSCLEKYDDKENDK